MTDASKQPLLSKVPQVTVFFWIIKVLCTTVGETASDYLSENIGLGLYHTSMVAGALLAVALVAQFAVKKYIPGLYWVVVVLVSVFGTLITDILTDGQKFPLEWSTIIFTGLLGATFAVWYAKEGTLSIHSIYTRRREAYYWLAILFTFALGTATGDLVAEKLAVGYLHTGMLVVGIIVAAGVAYRLGLDSVLSFWIAYILTRPLGASIGDYLSQPKQFGGIGLGATNTSIVFLSAILVTVAYLAVTHKDRIEHPEAPGAHEQKGRVARLQTAVVLGLFVALGVPGYYWRSAQLKEQAAAASTADRPLGDLARYGTIVQDMIGAAKSADWGTAESRADDLESTWDADEGVLHLMNDDKWTEMDNAIDVVLKKTRSTDKDAAAIHAALQSLAVIVHSLDAAVQIAGVDLSAPPPVAIDAGVTKPKPPPPPSSPDRPLGDLSKFRTIVVDLTGIVQAGDWAKAKSRATDLESAWDDAQDTLQPMNGGKWTEMDKAIDLVLKTARAGSHDAAATGAALTALTGVIDSLDPPK